jgi:hypothetical protein
MSVIGFDGHGCADADDASAKVATQSTIKSRHMVVRRHIIVAPAPLYV